MSMHSCVRGRIPGHLPEELLFWMHSCVRGKIRCIYLRDDDVGAFVCDG